MINSNTLKLTLLAILFIIAKSEDYCGSYNCYELLGVDQDADDNTIKKAFRQMAKKYHPDKNKQQDTTQLFQFINKAYEILIDEKSRFKYNLHLQNPQQSDFYHEYRYYSKKYIQDPQIHPSIVVITLLSLVSILQYVMRKQMYQRAILQITQSHDFKTKVNARCGNNKKIKDEVREQMVKQIQIEGGYSMPQIKDMLICKVVLLPYNIYLYVSNKAKWIYRYNIKKYAYSKQDQQMLTIKALNLTTGRWESIDEKERQDLLMRKLWVKQNMVSYRQEMRQKWLDELKVNNPNRYKMVMKHMAKNQ